MYFCIIRKNSTVNDHTSHKLIIISAPSGAGKTSIVKYLLQQDLKLAFSISVTSRPMRPGEVDKKDYYFYSVEEFKSKLEAGEFLEWQEVYVNQFYGTLKSEIERIWATGHHVLFDVDVLGGINIKKYYGDQALSIFIKPPSPEVLAQRLAGRGTETPESLAKRIAKADYELTFENQFDKVVVNDDLQVAQQETVKLIQDFLQQ